MKRRVRLAVILSALGGLALAIFLIAWFGAAPVLSALAAIGWRGLVLLACLHLVLMFICGCAWHAVMPAETRVALGIAMAARILRDAGSELLPISAAGGAVLGARALVLARMQGVMAFATTIVDVTVELMAQLCFTALGVIVLLRGGWAPDLGTPALAGLAIGVAAAFGFVLAQRLGFFRMLERLSARVAAREPTWRPPEGSVHDAIRDIYRRRSGIVVGLSCHFLAWTATTIEAWVALRLIGTPLPLGAVLMVESLLYALRSAAFFVPSGWGVQEGAYVVLGAVVGLSPGTALALSLAKRAREIAIGVPALLIWQAIETRAVRRALP
jgi:glycosyltransferase 2 family protein